MRPNKEQFSTTYTIKDLTYQDIPEVLELCKGNPLYYEFCPPQISEEGIREDMDALPPGIVKEDKYYVGYYDKDTLIAVLDLVLGYPNQETAYIGFFMMNQDLQGKGIGSRIIDELCQFLKSNYVYARLGYMKGNPQSEAFWKKNGFKPTGEEKPRDEGMVVLMQRKL